MLLIAKTNFTTVSDMINNKKFQQRPAYKQEVQPITALNYSLKNLSNAGQPLYFSKKTINQLIDGLEKNKANEEIKALAKESIGILEDISYNLNKIFANLHKVGFTLFEGKVSEMEYDYEEEQEVE